MIDRSQFTNRVGSVALVGLLIGLAACQRSSPTSASAAEPGPAAPAAPAVAAAPPPPPADPTFDQKIVPYLKKYCNECHNSQKQAGGVMLDAYMNEAHARKDRNTWLTIQKVITSGEMPPKKKLQPTKAETKFVADWIENSLTKVDCAGPKDPGRVTLRRLNRAEYNNTIRDLCGVTIKPAEDFPSDDVGYGFDNIGDVLSLQPILLEKYLSAAEKVLDAALAAPNRVNAILSSPAQSLDSTEKKVREVDAKGREIRRIILTRDGSAFREKFNFPVAGDYQIKVKAWGIATDGTAPKMAVRVNGKDLNSFTVDAPKDKPRVYETQSRIETGEWRLAAAFTNPSDDKADPKRTLGIESIEIIGPVGKNIGSDSAKKIITAYPDRPEDNAAAARKVLTQFARRAYRRPVKDAEIDRLMKLFMLAESQGDPYEKALRLPLSAVLVSPNFLFRIEDDPADPNTVRTISEHELATRLSYFLWSTMPDDELSSLADKGELRKPGVLKTQIERMLKDPKSSALVANFAGQWLMLRNLRTLSPDTGTFKGWDEALREAMIRESELYFEHIVKNDRSVLEFLDSNYTFVNGRLAQHYGIPNVRGPEFQQVKFTDLRRGGIVTQASVLTVTSNPTRTSPVKRGKWILENVLGTPPPPPAPDVPELPPVGQLKGTLRQQMEQHRANPSCANCHAKLDPLGFGLENFDGIGGWRTQDNKQPIDASGVLPDGDKFNGPADLRQVLLGKSDLFRRCLAEKLLTYSLGRGLEYYDKCALDDLVVRLKSGNDRFSALVLAIAESDAFQKRKGKRSE